MGWRWTYWTVQRLLTIVTKYSNMLSRKRIGWGWAKWCVHRLSPFNQDQWRVLIGYTSSVVVCPAFLMSSSISSMLPVLRTTLRTWEEEVEEEDMVHFTLTPEPPPPRGPHSSPSLAPRLSLRATSLLLLSSSSSSVSLLGCLSPSPSVPDCAFLSFTSFTNYYCSHSPTITLFLIPLL